MNELTVVGKMFSGPGSLDILAFVLLMGFTFAFSFLWGRSAGFLTKSRAVSGLAGILMGRLRAPYDKIRFFIIWGAYLLISIAGSLGVCLVNEVNIFRYAFTTGFGNVMLYFLCGFILQFGISSMLLLIINASTRDTNWYRVISQISWIKVSFNLPRKVRILYPASSAFLEETFFRCVLFLTLITRFPWVPAWLSIIIVTAAFVIEQAACTEKLKEAVVMGVGSLAISVSGCLVILISGSIIPAIMCHVMYVIFYLRDGKQ